MGKGLSPRLRITAPTGSTVTASWQSKTVTLKEVEEGIFEADVPALAPWEVSGAGFTKTVNVTDVARFEKSLEPEPEGETVNDCSWANISEISQAGTGDTFWDIGDCKEITLNGTIGTTAISNFSCYAFILGFDHNSAKEGANRIHFQIGRTAVSGGNHVCLVDSTYGSYNANNGSFTMNPAINSSGSKNAGGWNGSHMRKTLLGSDGSPTSPASNTFLAALPSDLRAVMKTVTKYTDNTGGGSDTASYVTATTDCLFLLSEFEVQGTRSYANSAEQNSQAQYKYYADGNSKVFNKHNANTTAATWWLRSPRVSNATGFCDVYTSGDASNSGSGYSIGVAPGFCV